MKYEITKEQILSLYMGGGNEGKFKEWFPEAFETVLEIGRWYFQTDSKALVNYQGGSSGYGFLAPDMEYIEEYHNWSFKTHRHEWREATESEIFEALKNEAVNREYIGNYVTLIAGAIGEQSDKIIKGFRMIGDNLVGYNHNVYTTLFSKGKWAEIIPTIKKEEAEKLLDKKIV